MTTKRIMGIIALVCISVVALFILILYATIKTKSTEISNYPPFKEWIGKTVILGRETLVFEERIPSKSSDYPYILLDNLHPRWENIHQEIVNGDVTEIRMFPAGTGLTVEKAIQYTNGVSGYSAPFLFGTITDDGKRYKIGYQWGKMNPAKFFDKIEECWQFHWAPWQKKQDTVFYPLPEAEWW